MVCASLASSADIWLRRLRAVLAALMLSPIIARADVFNMPAGQTSLTLVSVGNPGNPNDTFGGGRGRVAYNYNIGKYEITIGQYTAFLNAVAATDTFGLYNIQMGQNVHISGIARNGIPGSFTYSAIDSPNKPIAFVSWGDAARFANWLTMASPWACKVLRRQKTARIT